MKRFSANLIMNSHKYILTFLIVLLPVSLFEGCHSKKLMPDSQKHSGLAVISVEPFQTPVFLNRSENRYFAVSVDCNDLGKGKRIRRIVVNLSEDSDRESVGEISVNCYCPATKLTSDFGESAPSAKMTLEGNYAFSNGTNIITVNVSPSDKAELTDRFGIGKFTIVLDDGTVLPVPVSNLPVLRFGTVVREAGQIGIDTYRIPGLVTTNAGTLIAVYDNRYNNSKDLQEDIDIGMSRSTDGGRTWEPMKVIIDMGEYGGLGQQLNGIGDPSVLYDHVTNTLWVAALWMSGSAPDKMLWWASQSGMTPTETGQFILVRSTDDGVTWTQPINITDQIKDPSWQLLLQGPGRGITLTDGTLVFPAQFKKDIGVKALDGGLYTCHSTIIYSKDGGNSWHIGTGAKPNTTEAQVAELSDGSLMLNMRDDRNRSDKGATNGRAVAITRDFGQTWTVHPSSNSALPEPNCMASLIAADLNAGGVKQKVLFFSNPDDKYSRIKMTVKASLDEGMTWPEVNRIELYGPLNYGYSCLTMVDHDHLGILYEGTGELFFQKIPVNDFF